MISLRLFLCVSFFLPSFTFARDFRPEAYFEEVPATDGSVLQCYVFKTTPGIKYRVEASNDLITWTSPQNSIYGLGHEYVITMRQSAAAPTPDPQTPPASPNTPAAPATICMSIRMQPASGTGGGTVVSWPSLDDGGPVIVKIEANLDLGWAAVPLYVQNFGNYQFLVWHPPDALAPPTENSILGPQDSAMLAVLEANLAAMNQEIATSVFLSRNAPPPPPSNPDSLRFWRIQVDSSTDTDSDGSPDWSEYNIATSVTGILTSGVRGDAFNADTNSDGIRDGQQLDGDRDGTPDATDINSSDNTATFAIGLVPRYALFPITNATPTPEWPSPLQINNNGTVLYANGTWKGGVWQPLTLEVSGILIYASARGINDSDQILGIGYDDAASSFPFYYAGLACYWPIPTALPSVVEIGGPPRNRAGNIDIGTTARDLFENRLSPGPVLANDGGFYSPVNQLKADQSEWIFQRHSRWKLPSNGQPITETAAAATLRYSTGPGLQWGFDPARTDGSTTAGGSIIGSVTPPVLPFTPINVFTPTPNLVLALPGSNDSAQSVAFIDGKWEPSETYANASDIAADGTAIGKFHPIISAPISINGKWADIKRTVPIPSDMFNPPPVWHGSTVSLIDTTSGGWILAQRGSEWEMDYSVLLPVRAEGYYSKSDGVPITAATGVDDFSIGSETPGIAIQDRIWIMAPQGGFNKIVKFKAPLNSNTPLNLSASNILFGGQESVTINGAVSPVTLRAADNVLSGGERLMNLTMGSGNDEVSSVSKPIGLKIMKGRTVKVTVYKVTKLYGTAAEEAVNQVMMPTQEEITNHLKDMFRPQINTLFNVNLVEEPLKVAWDTNNDVKFDIKIGVGDPGEEKLISDRVPANPDPYDIRVFVVANTAPLGSGVDAYGITDRANRTCWVLGSKFGKNKNKPYLLDTIAHEIGHVFIGGGHPDQNALPGPAPLPGTKHNCRLMCSGSNSDGSSRLLVKKEWDEAEIWLKAVPDKRVFDSTGNIGSY